MLVIRLGDLINKPQSVRAQQAERVRGSTVRAEAAEQASSEQRKKQGEEARRQQQWCEAAFWSLHEALAAALRTPEHNPTLFSRLCNRHELQLVLMTSSEMASLSHSQMQAWGTGGLHPHELRAIYFALQRSPPSGRPAQLFISRLKDRVAALPPPEDAAPAVEKSTSNSSQAKLRL